MQEIYYKNYEEKPVKLSIITATWNAEKFLPRLIKSLQAQTDMDFEWVIADGASTDSTLEILKAVEGLNIKVLSQEDFGIYDALNRGIKACNGEFYLVMGADDELYPNGVGDYKNAIENGVDIVTASIETKNGISKVADKGIRSRSWFSGMSAYVSGHAVGSIYRKSLHDEFGYYSRKYPIVADQLFVLKARKGNAEIKQVDEVVGKFDDGGVSGTDNIGFLTEMFRLQLGIGENKSLQTILFILRLFKNYKDI